MNDIHSLAHSKWNCKYHIVFAPKYRRKTMFGAKGREIGAILRELCKWKGVNIIEAELLSSSCNATHNISFMDALKGGNDILVHLLL